MTVVEVLVAGLVLVAGALAVLTVVDAATHNTHRAQQSQVVADLLQAELEKLRGMPYDELALASLPPHDPDSASPDSRVAGTEFYLGRDSTHPAPLVYDAEAGKVSPAASFEVGGVRGTVHRYVTWDSCPSSLCEDGDYLKRVVVAARLDPTASGGVRTYQEVQGQVVDPGVKPADNPGPPPGGEEKTPWTLWLTDTTCNHASRQPPSADHQSHNTRGTCSAGLKTEDDCVNLVLVTNCPSGAPDLMEEVAPPDEPERPLYDYATDVEPKADADEDVGLTLRPTSGGCNAISSLVYQLPLVSGLLDSAGFQKVHKWLSPPIPGGIDVELEGRGTLNLWTKTMNSAVQPGKICVGLFTRQLSLGIPVDTPAVNLDLTDGLLNLNYFSLALPQWPSSGWTEVAVPLHFTLNAKLLPGSQLGVALWVAGSGSANNGLEFLYDARSFDSRLELQVANTVSLPIFG